MMISHISGFLDVVFLYVPPLTFLMQKPLFQHASHENELRLCSLTLCASNLLMCSHRNPHVQLYNFFFFGSLEEDCPGIELEESTDVTGKHQKTSVEVGTVAGGPKQGKMWCFLFSAEIFTHNTLSQGIIFCSNCFPVCMPTKYLCCMLQFMYDNIKLV